jgi:hypothetical protein
MKIVTQSLRSGLAFIAAASALAIVLAACSGGDGGGGGGGTQTSSSSGGASSSTGTGNGNTPPPSKAAFGADCKSADDCSTGMCLKGDWGGFCTRQCTKAADCPEQGWVCNISPYTACVPQH